jgi:ribose transport system substrate-binding protein
MNKKSRVGLVMKSLEADFFQKMKKGALEYAEKRNDFELITVGTLNQTNVDMQISLVEELIGKRVDAIVVIPIDSKALVPAIVKAIKAGIKITNIDILLNEDLLKEAGVELAFVGPDNEEAAKMVGDVLAKKIGRGGKVIIINGIPEAMNAQQRRKGFIASIEEYGLNLLGEGVASWETEKAMQVFADLYQKFPEVQGVFCGNDAMASGVIKILESLGKAGNVEVVGFDNDTASGQLIRDGKLLATIDAFGTEMAALGIDYALRALKGEIINGWIKTKTELIT